jgi:hypothetical protein
MGAGKTNKREVITSCLIKPRKHPSEMLYLSKKALDDMPILVNMLIVFPLQISIFLGWHHHFTIVHESLN